MNMERVAGLIERAFQRPPLLVRETKVKERETEVTWGFEFAPGILNLQGIVRSDFPSDGMIEDAVIAQVYKARGLDPDGNPQT